MTEHEPKKISDLIQKVVSELNIPEELLEKAKRENPDSFDAAKREELIETMRLQLIFSRKQIDESDMSIAGKIEFFNRWNLAAELYETAKETHEFLLSEEH